MIISHIADLAAAKRVEKVRAAVQQFLECGTNRIGKVAETPSVFTMEKWQTLMYAVGPVCCQCHIGAATCSDWNIQLVRK